MGIVNATPDSFSDAPGEKSLEDRVELARKLIADGADIIDVGGESGVTNRPAVAAAEEIDRVTPVIAAISALPGAVVSVDTYKPAVARAAIAAGARIVNDVSGLADDDLAAAAANLVREGDEASFTTAAPARRLGNYMQISTKTFIVSDTLEVVDKAGRRTETGRLGTKLLKELGYGKGYQYDPDAEDGFSGANYFPEGMERRTFYRPKGEGHEAKVKDRLERWAEMRARKQSSARED